MKRRQFLKQAGVVLLCAGSGLGLLWRRRGEQVFRQVRPLMGSFGEIQILHREARQAAQVLEQAFGELRRLESTLSRYRPESEIGQANCHAYHKRVAISEMTATLLQRGLTLAEELDGLFDPAIGDVADYWKKKEGGVALWDRQLFKHVSLTSEQGQWYLSYSHPLVSLDLGGIAKGFAADYICERLQEWGIETGLVNVGGEVRTFGSRQWKVGIRHPERSSKVAKILTLCGEGVATSGNYEQFVRSRQQILHHLIHPWYGIPWPEDRMCGVTVVADSAELADVLATALFFLSRERGVRRAETFGCRAIYLES